MVQIQIKFIIGIIPNIQETNRKKEKKKKKKKKKKTKKKKTNKKTICKQRSSSPEYGDKIYACKIFITTRLRQKKSNI